MKTSIGFANCPDSYLCGMQCAEQVVPNGVLTNAVLVLAFCSGNHHAESFYNGLRKIINAKVPIIGGSAIGIITNHQLTYEGHPGAILVISTDDNPIQVAFAQGIDKEEFLIGTQLGRQLSAQELKDCALLLFYDSIKQPPTSTTPPIMNASPPLIAGIESILGMQIPIVGAGLIGDYGFGRTSQFCGFSVGQQCAVAAILPKSIKAYVQIMHGCMPLDGIYHKITKMDGAIIYEVDGKPIVEMIDQIYGNQAWREQRPLKRLSIGVNHGEKFGAIDEDKIVTRLISGITPQGNGIILFEPDLEEGMEFLFMLRDNEIIIRSVQQNSTRIIERILQEGYNPLVGLYIDCAGRTSTYSESIIEEAEPLQRIFNGKNIPLLGFYSGVEIAPIMGKSRGLDWTGVLLVLAEG